MIFLTQMNNALDALVSRVSRDERGQTAAEFTGIVVIIAMIIAAIIALDLHTTISNALQNAVQGIVQGG